MICADSSTWINFFDGESTAGTARLAEALSNASVCIPPPVLTELLSFGGVRPEQNRKYFEDLPQLPLKIGFWERAGEMRRQLLQKRLKARSMDCLIAQSCIDEDIALIADDTDFRHFVGFGLRLV